MVKTRSTLTYGDEEDRFSANETDIELARELADRQNTTLDELFREWLRALTAGPRRARDYRVLMEKLRYVNAGRKFTREQMNER